MRVNNGILAAKMQVLLHNIMVVAVRSYCPASQSGHEHQLQPRRAVVAYHTMLH